MEKCFSITVPDGRVEEWEFLRRTVEEVVCAMDGVESAVVTLTAEKNRNSLLRCIEIQFFLHQNADMDCL